MVRKKGQRGSNADTHNRRESWEILAIPFCTPELERKEICAWANVTRLEETPTSFRRKRKACPVLKDFKQLEMGPGFPGGMGLKTLYRKA